jgi:pimeloyl-ACP methyl ester carboxylesterase
LHRYGDHREQLAELFLPDGDPDEDLRVVVLIHGGFWRDRYRRDLMEPLAHDLCRRGVAAWNIEFRRLDAGGGWPETGEDVATAIDALAGLEAPLDLDDVTVVGHSAGGHLALWAAAGSPRRSSCGRRRHRRGQRHRGGVPAGPRRRRRRALRRGRRARGHLADPPRADRASRRCCSTGRSTTRSRRR